MPKEIRTNHEEIKRNTSLKLDDNHDYSIQARIFTDEPTKYRILILNKFPFVENYVYADIIQDSTLDPMVQEDIIMDKLLTSLSLDIKFPASGYLTNLFMCTRILNETRQASFIKDKIVSFRRMQEVQSLFPIETVTTYTNSEYIPQTKIAC